MNLARPRSVYVVSTVANVMCRGCADNREVAAVELEALDAGLTKAFARFLTQYSELGGHRSHGFIDYGDPRNYQGPLL